MHELPLVFFTVLSQSAVGAFVLLYISYRLTQINERQLAVGLTAAMVVFIIGLLLGTFHVGQPLRAFNMLLGVGRSPMSNEIVLSGVFGLFGCLTALGMLLKKGTARLHQILAMITVVVGIAFVVSIPAVYQLDTVPAWNSSFTSGFMMLTVLIGGGALAALFGAWRIGLPLSCAAIVISLVMRANAAGELFMANATLADAQTSWFTVQAVLMIGVLALGLFFALRRSGGKMLLATCASLAIVGELLGRIAFYNLWSVAM